MYVTGKVSMAMVDELGSATGATTRQLPTRGCFVIWQMVPKKWQIELVVGRHKVVAGSDGNVAWRRTPWLGSHTAKGGVRPLRRSLQVSWFKLLRNIIRLVSKILTLLSSTDT